MQAGSGLLALAVVILWVLVFLFTQVAVRPPLGTPATVVIGAALSVVLILGYPSPVRGPHVRLPRLRARRGRQRIRRRRRSEGPGSPMALVGRRIPLRSGLTPQAAERTVLVLQPLLAGDAVAITDRERVLAFVGPGRDHHRPGEASVTDATRRVLASGLTAVITPPQRLGCAHAGCPLRSGTIAPLTIGKRVVGTLKVYRRDEVAPSAALVEGMAAILSLHLELAELDRDRQLAVDAKLDALRAQINPHFLFNTLNTIASKSRTDPEEARQLLLRLSDFFRYSVRQHGQFAEFTQEYFFVRTYVALEQARFGDRLVVRYDVDPQVLAVQVPVLTIQPLVENAIKHGLSNKVDGGAVTLRARVNPLARTTLIRVRDDGVGIEPERLRDVLNGEGPQGGIGLRNISERLESLFGDRYSFDIQSRPGAGTTVTLRIPLR